MYVQDKETYKLSRRYISVLAMLYMNIVLVSLHVCIASTWVAVVARASFICTVAERSCSNHLVSSTVLFYPQHRLTASAQPLSFQTQTLRESLATSIVPSFACYGHCKNNSGYQKFIHSL